MNRRTRAGDERLELLHRILKARGGFGHREHLELAWAYLGLYSTADAERAMAAAIREVAKLHGAPDRYHDTITRAWLRLVALHRADQAATFDEFLKRNPGLLDRGLLGRHYSRATLASDAARRAWVDPDLRELPAHA